jgi:hypothetical protein
MLSRLTREPVTMTARRLPLRGADLVLMAMQQLWADATVSHNTLLVVQCDGPVAPDRIRRALDQLLDVYPWPASRLRRPFPWGSLHWAAGPRGTLAAPPVRHRAVGSPEELHETLETELNSAIDPRREPPLRFLIVEGGPEPGAAPSVLVLTWFHPLMDPRGGENLLAHLAVLDRAEAGAPRASALTAFVADPDRRSLRERGRLARRSLEYMRGLTPDCTVSPGTGLPTAGPALFRQAAFVDDVALAADRRSTRDICWRLALVGQAMGRLWEKRKLPDVPFLVPVSVDLRPKGEAGPTFGNWLAFHFARFRRSDTSDVVALAKALRRQMVDAMRDGQIEANAVAMEFLKYRPLWMMPRYLPAASRRETFSFNCADVKGFPSALDTIFGHRVVNAYHVPAVLPRPGIGVFFNRCATTNNLVVSWIDGAASEDEVTRIIEVVREGMGWVKTA